MATPIKTSGTDTNVMRSVPETPTRNRSTRRVAASASIRPTALPVATRINPPRMTSRTTSPACAPNEMRIPISRIRLETVKFTTPYNPTLASAKASMAKIDSSPAAIFGR